MTAHPGTGPCHWHDGKQDVELTSATGELLIGRPKKPGKQSSIYDKGLIKGDPKKLLKMLSGQSNQEKLSLTEELSVARAMLLQLQQSALPDAEGKPRPLPDNFYSESARLLDVISKLVERSQPRSTLTVNNVQSVLLKIVDVVGSEVQDTLVMERIINKLSSIVLVQK
jgi:hypothetical protein